MTLESYLLIAVVAITLLFIIWCVRRHIFYRKTKKYIGQYCMIGICRKPSIPLEGKTDAPDGRESQKEMMCHWGVVHKMTPRWVVFTEHCGNKIHRYITYLIRTKAIDEITIENEPDV